MCISLRLGNSTPRCLLTKNEVVCLQKCKYNNVNNSFILTSPKMKISQCLSTRKMDTQIVIYSNKDIIHQQNERNMNKSQNHYYTE